MKRFVLAVVFALTAAVAYAGTYSIQACTTDHKAATLGVTIEEGASKEVVEGVRVAFTKAANSMTAAEIVGDKGYEAFVGNMTAEQINAIEDFDGPPSITDSPACK